MISKKCKAFFCAMICCLLINGIIFGANTEDLSVEKQEFKQERTRIKALRKSFKPGPVNNLKKYEKFADEIQNKWNKKNKEHYARLMLEVCGPLSSGRFKEDRQIVLARKYGLLALKDANEIPLTLELELTGHVITDMYIPRAPKGQKWEQLRKKDIQIRFHAWKRLVEAIDPAWDSNDFPLVNVAPPIETGFPAGITPEAIKDPKLRAEYEAALEKNMQKAKRYNEQYSLRKWLRRFPPRVERYIIRAYSMPPFNMEELRQYLNTYIADTKTRNRILSAVTKNVEKQAKKQDN